MSLISLSSADQEDNADFRNFFYKGIKLKPQSQVACISAVMNYSQELVIDESNDTFGIQVGHAEFLNKTFNYKIPHGVYTVEALVSLIDTNVLTTINVSYLRGSKASGGFDLNFTSTDTPPDTTKGLEFVIGFTPLSTSTAPTCKSLSWYGKDTSVGETVSFGSNGDGTTITKSDTHGDDDNYDGIFYTENSLMENQHATFIIRKSNGEDWTDNTDCPLGIYGIFSTTDFEKNNTTQFFSQENLDSYELSVRPLFGFAIGEDDAGDVVILEQLESAYDITKNNDKSTRINQAIDDAGAGAIGEGIFELDNAEDLYYIRIWLGQNDTDADYDNNSAWYFITTSAPNDTFVPASATWKSWMKFGTKFYPLRVGGGIKQNDSTIAIKMCATDKNLSTEVLERISNQFSPATWITDLHNNYDYKQLEEWAKFPPDGEAYTDGGSTAGRPARQLIFRMMTDYNLDEDNPYVNLDVNFGSVFNFAPTMVSSTLVATGDYSYNNANFKTGTIDKPYTTAQPSLHIQLSNLPIQSYNGNTSSVIRTIAVIPRERYSGYQGNWTASNINWININNSEELMMSELDIRITDNSNKVIRNLRDDTEVVLMFR